MGTKIPNSMIAAMAPGSRISQNSRNDSYVLEFSVEISEGADPLVMTGHALAGACGEKAVGQAQKLANRDLGCRLNSNDNIK